MHLYIDYITNHLDKLIGCGTMMNYGPDPNAMWMASLNVYTGQPVTLNRDEHQLRTKAYIHAPRGGNAYWDQPQLAAACATSEITGDTRYQNAAVAYTQDFLKRSVSRYGLLLWGNHYFYDAAKGETVWHKPCSPPQTLGLHRVTAYLHELRPITPAWKLMWQVDAKVTEQAIRAMGRYHLYDPGSNGFSVHADQERYYDFLEAGAVLVESLVWLYRQAGDRRLLRQALKIARHSFQTRNLDTGLLPVANIPGRWYHQTATTEVGLWASALLRAAHYTGHESFITMAQAAVSAYLYFAWDAETRLYFGRLNVTDGTPQTGDFLPAQITARQPETHANIWNARFPSHDYPLALAEACVSLYELTHASEFEIAVDRWANIVHRQSDYVGPQYAEQIGRAIHFLVRAAQAFPASPYHTWAADLASDAINTLFAGGMFRGHTGEDHYQAVDGVGYLLLALLELETGHILDTYGFGF